MDVYIPSIVTTTGGGQELILDGDSGYIVPVKDSQAIAEKIRVLVQDSEKRITMGKKAQKRIQEEFPVKKHSKTIYRFF